MKLVIGGLAIIAIIGSYFFPRGNSIIQRVPNTVGSVVSLDNVDSGYTSIGGVKTFYFSQAITATSSRFCIMRNPYAATSTIVSFSTNFASATPFTTVGGGASQAVEYTVSTTSTTGGYGSSTPFLMKHGIPASSLFDSSEWFGGMPTTSMAFANVILPMASSSGETFNKLYPNQYLVWSWGTTTQGTAGSFTYWPQGQCKAVVRSDN